jgi:hypothetical protein
MVSLIDSNEQWASFFCALDEYEIHFFEHTGGLNRNVSFGHSKGCFYLMYKYPLYRGAQDT